MRPLVLGCAAGVLIALAATAQAPAATRAGLVAHGRCDRDLHPAVFTPRTRMGPLEFVNWNGYANWHNMEAVRNRDDGTYYAKAGMYARPRTIASLSIAPAYRHVADLVYGRGRNGSHVLSDVVRIHSCRRHTTFFSGGLVVRAPACVELQVRVRGRHRVYRKMVSINKGDGCPRLAPL